MLVGDLLMALAAMPMDAPVTVAGGIRVTSVNHQEGVVHMTTAAPLADLTEVRRMASDLTTAAEKLAQIVAP